MSSNNPRNWTPSGVCSPTQPNSFPPHVPLVQRQFDCEDRGPRKPEKNKHIGHIYEWSNGERLDPNIDCHLAIGAETTIHKLVDGKELFCNAPPGEYKAELLQNFDENKLTTARQELKDALDAIIDHEKEEAAALKKIQDKRSAFNNYIHLRYKEGRGFFLAGVGLVKTVKEWTDIVNPLNQLSNMLSSAWDAKSTDGQSWVTSFTNNYSAAQQDELAKALGFDPKKIKLEHLTHAYETSCFIFADGPSKKLLADFIKKYARAQNAEEVAEFSGAVLFEIVLAAILMALTGGAGLAIRVAGAISKTASNLLVKLGHCLINMGKLIKTQTIKTASYVKGVAGQFVKRIKIPRPKKVPITQIVLRDWSHLTISQRHFPHKVSIPKKNRQHHVYNFTRDRRKRFG